MMRIAYITADPGVPVFGRKGCSIHVQEVLRAMIKRGAQIELFAANCSGVPPADLAAVHLYPLMLPPRATWLSVNKSASPQMSRSALRWNPRVRLASSMSAIHFGVLRVWNMPMPPAHRDCWN